MTRDDEINRRNARLAKREVRDLYLPKPNADKPGFQSFKDRRKALLPVLLLSMAVSGCSTAPVAHLYSANDRNALNAMVTAIHQETKP